MQQTCKMCGQPDKFDFHIPNEIWKAVVPEEFRTMVVCLYCFDEEAAAKGVNYAEAISEFCFAGRAVALGLKVTRWGDAAAMTVVLDSEDAIEGAVVDVADGLRAPAIRHGFFARDPGFEDRGDESTRDRLADAVPRLVLAASENAGVEADEGEPFRLARSPAAAAKDRGPLRESAGRGGRRGGGSHGQGRAVRSGRSRSAKMTTSATVHAATGMTMRTTTAA